MNVIVILVMKCTGTLLRNITETKDPDQPVPHLDSFLRFTSCTRSSLTSYTDAIAEIDFMVGDIHKYTNGTRCSGPRYGRH